MILLLICQSNPWTLNGNSGMPCNTVDNTNTGGRAVRQKSLSVLEIQQHLSYQNQKRALISE